VRRVQPAEAIDASQKFGRYALHHPVHLAENIGMQPAEIGDARRRAHAAEKAVTLDQQRPPPRPRRRDRSRNPGRPAAEDCDVIFAIERDLARGFGDGFHSCSRSWIAAMCSRASAV
jgi:hypothetical protein